MIHNSILQNNSEAHERGFQHAFQYVNETLVNTSNNKKYGINECKLLYYDRFAGYSGSAAPMHIYYIACKDGTLGYLLNTDSRVHDQLMKLDKQMN